MMVLKVKMRSTTYTASDMVVDETVISSGEYFGNFEDKDRASFCSRKGWSERAQRKDTCAGFTVYVLTSTSPDGGVKCVREFEPFYEYAGYN